FRRCISSAFVCSCTFLVSTMRFLRRSSIRLTRGSLSHVKTGKPLSPSKTLQNNSLSPSARQDGIFPALEPLEIVRKVPPTFLQLNKRKLKIWDSRGQGSFATL